MKNQYFLSRREFLRLAVMVAGSQVLSACASNPKPGDGPKEDKTAPAQLALAEYAKDCEKNDGYKGLNSTVTGFSLDLYQCVYLSQRAVVWAIKTEAPEKYVAEGPKIDEAIGKIETYLTRSLSDYYQKGERVHFFYGDTDAAFTTGRRYSRPVIFMPRSSDPYSFHNYVHEMTHLLTPQHSDWVFEGLAVYLNDRWGGEGGFPNFGKDVDPLARYYLDRADILVHIGDETYYPTRADLRTSVGEGFYILSGSFVKYLVEKTGIEKFMQIYNAPNMQEGLKTATQKTLEEWKTEWTGYVANLKS
jgi:hypothetical protein